MPKKIPGRGKTTLTVFSGRRFPFLRIKGFERIKRDKSQTDFALRDELSRMYYQDGVRKFVIMSSDSDFGSLCQQYSDAEFFFVLQRTATAYEWAQKMIENKIPHVYIDETFRHLNYAEYNILTLSRAAARAGFVCGESEEQWRNLWEKFQLPESIIPKAKKRFEKYISNSAEIRGAAPQRSSKECNTTDGGKLVG